VFAAGHCLLVYPGSDYETFRSFGDRKKVILAGRTGFLRLALRERVPIVPVVSAGANEQMIVLTRGDRLARLFHAHAWARTDVFPIVLALPWGVTSGFVPYLPLPAQTTVSFGAPISWPALGPEEAERPDVVAACYRQVEGAMQSDLDRLMDHRRFLLGKRPC
jgi:1-acyl-sn-glycerol-3-phosphate acyltransferase